MMTQVCLLVCKPENVLELFSKLINRWTRRGGVGSKGDCSDWAEVHICHSGSLPDMYPSFFQSLPLMLGSL